MVTKLEILSISRAGSIFQAYPGFIPDYTIKATSDVLYLKIKRTTYLRAMKASLMGKKASHSGELNERELEHLLEKVGYYLVLNSPPESKRSRWGSSNSRDDTYPKKGT